MTFGCLKRNKIMTNHQENLKNIINNMDKTETKQCTNPQHFPPPLYVSIPAGHVYKYKCPTCDHVTELHGTDIKC